MQKSVTERLFQEAGQKVAENGGDPGLQWANYLEELKVSDPEEYKLLMEDIEEFVKDNEANHSIITPGGSQANKENSEPEFAPMLPGGEKVLGKKGVTQHEEGVVVEPEAGFVIKTRRESGEKIFINICQSPLIQKMSTKKQLASDGSEQEGINIPLSLGPERIDKDKSGEVCLVYDIIVNPEVILNAKQDKTGSSRSFLCELALQYVEQKSKSRVDYKYKLPKMLYKGDRANIPSQMIRKRHTPVIEEVSTEKPSLLSATSQSKNNVIQNITQRRPPQPLPYKLVRITNDGNEQALEAALSDPVLIPPAENESPGLLVFEAALERAKEEPALLKDIKISVSEEFLMIRSESYYQPLELFLPHAIDEKLASSRYIADRYLLRIEMPLRSSSMETWRHTSDPDPGSRPWLLAQALGSDREEPPNAASQVVSNQDQKNEKESPIEEDDVLPEDRFHLADMLSQHIKDERERERNEKVKRHEEEEDKRKEEEALAAKEAKKKAIKKILQEAEQQVRAEHDQTVTILDDTRDEEVEEDDDLLV